MNVSFQTLSIPRGLLKKVTCFLFVVISSQNYLCLYLYDITIVLLPIVSIKDAGKDALKILSHQRFYLSGMSHMKV